MNADMKASLLFGNSEFELYGKAIQGIAEESGKSRSRMRSERESLAERELLNLAFGEGSHLTHGEHGEPYITESPEVNISISHNRSHCLLAISKTYARIGVDVENPRAQLLRVRDKYLTVREFIFTRKLGPGELMPALTVLWTVKEAVYKAAGQPGLSLTDIEISLDQEETDSYKRLVPDTILETKAYVGSREYGIKLRLLAPDNYIAVAIEKGLR